MKLVVLFLTIGFLQQSLAAKSQTITLNLKNATLTSVFKEIRKQSGYDFFYDTDLLKFAEPVNISLNQVSLEEALLICFNDQPFNYYLVDQTVIIKPKPQQQEERFNVQGKVTDQAGQPLPGASVRIKGTKIGTSTGTSGEYSLMVPKGKILSFTMVGFEKIERTINNGNQLDIKLVEEESDLGDVVVIGYGTRSREKVTGAISSITAKEIENLPATSFQDMLQGRIPGLNVLSFSGEPGAGSIALIRGLSGSSRNGAPANTSPLYVIDGMPFSMEDYGAIPSLKGAAIKTTNTDPLSMINPNDIESIDVLKDASATAIYGSRGANGVIIVKTKAGKLGKPTITFNSSVGLSSPPPFRETLGGRKERDMRMKYLNKYASLEEDYVKINNLAFVTDSLNAFHNNSTNWQDLFYAYTAIQNYTLGISGSVADQVTYRTNFGFSDEGGIMKATGFKRYTGSTNFIFRPSNKLDVNLDISGTYSNKKRGNGADQNAMGIGSNFNTSLFPAPQSELLSEYFKAYDLLDEKLNNMNLRTSLGINYRFMEDFKFTTNLRLGYGTDTRNTFKPSKLNTNKKPSLNTYFGQNTTLLNENILSYFKTFSKHTLITDLGVTNDFLIRENTRTNALDGMSDYVKVISGFPKERVTTIEDYSKSVRLSYFGRVNYDYDGKYIFSASFRRDGSSRFGDNNRWGNFPAGAFAWNIHKESFLQDVSWLTSMKLRVSSGVSGTEFSYDYLTQGLYDIGAAGDVHSTTAMNSYNGVITANPWYDKGLTNETLTWERSTDKNLGLDIQFLKGKYSFNFDFYWKESRGKLFDLALPNTSGYKMIYSNGQDVLNYGYEFSVYADLLPAESKLRWSINANAALNRNVLLKIGDNDKDVYVRSYDRLLRVGRPLNDFYVHRTLGVYKTDADVPVNPKTGALLTGSSYPFKAGDIIIADLDGNYRVGYEVNNANGELMTDDKIYGGNPNPTVTGGFRSDFKYNRFSFSTFFTYSFGRKIINRTLADRLNPAALLLPNSLPDVEGYDMWENPGDDATYAAYDPFNKNNNLNYDYKQTLFVEDGSFVRLKNIQLSYELESSLLKRLNFKRLNVFGQMENVFIIQKFNGPDAENVDFSGIDRGGFYPIPRKMTFGFNLQF